MTARRVHAVMAAGVQHPDLIARWQEDPGFLLSQGIEPGGMDLTALWKFAGLTVKVRHNGIRRELPITFRFMSLAGMEIELFASYATFCATKGRQYAATPDGRTRDLIAFLEQWLDFDSTVHCLLWDLIRHEQALALLAKSNPSTSSPVARLRAPPSRRVPSGRNVPFIWGEIILREMRCEPRVVESMLFRRAPQIGQILLGIHYYCYWRSPSATEVQILELDAFGYYALSFIDGICSVAELSVRLGGERSPTPAFLQVLSQLVGIGILDFQPRSKARGA